MRGTHQSGGNFTVWHSDANDAFDTMQWIAQQNWSSGVTFTVGASADGLASFTMPLSTPTPPTWLRAQFIIFASSVGYEVIFPQGGYRQALANLWIQSTVPTQAPAVLALVQANEAPGSWWDALNMTTHYADVSWPSVMWAGWYDIFLTGNLIGFEGYQKNSSPGGRGRSFLVVDPLGHCQGAFIYFPRNLILGRVALPVLLSFDLLAPGGAPAEDVSAVTFYVMGPANDSATGNYWTSLPDWPAFTPTQWYFWSDNSLRPTPPATSDVLSYDYDPRNPVPTMGGNNLELACGPEDQRPIEGRADVLLFTSAVLTEDMALTGPIDATLFVSSNATDTDFTVKITDVYPDGTSRLLQDGIVRMRWRGAPYTGTSPRLLTPGTVYPVSVSLWNTSYVFNKGHQIRVAVSSSNSIRFSANPNNGLPLSKNGTGPLIVAHNSLHLSPSTPSSITLPVVALSQLPQFPVEVAINNLAARHPAVFSKLQAYAADWETNHASKFVTADGRALPTLDGLIFPKTPLPVA